MTIAEYQRIHRENRDRYNSSLWYATYKGRRRLVRLQMWKGRLYLEGRFRDGLRTVVEFEAPLGAVIKALGHLTPAQFHRKS